MGGRTSRTVVRHSFLSLPDKKKYDFLPNQSGNLSFYNQTVYGSRETEGRPFAGHAGHARSQDIDAGPFAWVCDRATDSAIVRRSAARRGRLSLPGSPAARVEWLDRGRMGPLGQQPA